MTLNQVRAAKKSMMLIKYRSIIQFKQTLDVNEVCSVWKLLRHAPHEGLIVKLMSYVVVTNCFKNRK